MSENAIGCTWPESEAVTKWVKAHKVEVDGKAVLELCSAVSEYRIRIQNEPRPPVDSVGVDRVREALEELLPTFYGMLCKEWGHPNEWPESAQGRHAYDKARAALTAPVDVEKGFGEWWRHYSVIQGFNCPSIAKGYCKDAYTAALTAPADGCEGCGDYHPGKTPPACDGCSRLYRDRFKPAADTAQHTGAQSMNTDKGGE